MFECRICGSKHERFKTIEGMYSHLEKVHGDEIPNGWSVQQYAYYLKTGKTHGNCVICKGKTKFNLVTGKYYRLCEKKACSDKNREIFKKRMIGKYGKVSLLDDPEQQKKMLANRKISGTYTWSDGKKFTYTGSYELDFLRFLDVFLNFPSQDIECPSPHTYYYEYEGKKHFYIPDVYIQSLNLEIEVKDGGNNPNTHHKIQEVDKIKETLKDKVMLSQSAVSYVKVTNKEYDTFFKYLYKMKDQYNDKDDKFKPIFVLGESAFSDEFTDSDVLLEAMDSQGQEVVFYISSEPKLKTIRPSKSKTYPNLGNIILASPFKEFATALGANLSKDHIKMISTIKGNNLDIKVELLDKYAPVENKFSIYVLSKEGFEPIVKDGEPSKVRYYKQGDAQVIREIKVSNWRRYINRFPNVKLINFPNDEEAKEIEKEKLKESYEFTSVSESTKSTLDNNYKPKGKKNLSTFKRVHITKMVIDKYKKEYPFLKHVRCEDTKEYICDGYIWFDNDDLVAMVGSCEYTDDKTKWVVSLEITKNYKGYGLSKQILDYTVKTMNCKYLSVNKNNKIAKKVYNDYGFKVYHEDDTMYYMTIEKEKLKESSFGMDTFTEIFGEGRDATVEEQQNVTRHIEEISEETGINFWDEVSPVTEAKLPLNVYHGSKHLFDVLRATGIDFGNSFQDMGWSLFAWTNRKAAIGWGVWEVFRHLKTIDENIILNGCLNSQTTVVWQSVYEYLKENIHKYSEDDLALYVYTVPTKTNYEYGLGHSSNTPRCVTIRTTEDIIYSKVDKIIMDIDMVEKYCKIVPDGYEPTNKEYGKNYRLTSFLMKYDFMYQPKLRNSINNAVKSGELQPGDDLRSFFKNNNIDLKTVSFKERISDIISKESIDMELVTESVNTMDEKDISYSNSFSDVKNIVDSLPKEDLNKICNGEFKNSPYVFYREVLLVKKEPVAFIDVYKLPDMKEDGVIVIATKEKWRRFGLGARLASRMKSKLKDKNLIWKTQKDNTSSKNLAKKMKFKPTFESTDTELVTEEANNIRKYNFIYLDLKKDNVDKYLKQNSYCREYMDYVTKDCIGEIAVDKDADKIAGFIFMDNKKYKGFISPLIVEKKYRNVGLGTKLLKDAISEYGAKDLVVKKSNKVALDMYLKNGFVPIGYGSKGKSEYWLKLKSRLTNEDKMLDITESVDMELVTEEANYSSTNKYPVFIVLMHSGTTLANVIKAFTRDEFSHACISFNSKLDPLYSFGNKKVNIIDPGFVIQNPDSKFYKRHKAYYNVFVMYVDKASYDKMQEKLQFFIDNKDDLKYDLASLFKIASGKPSEESKKYFCSKFCMNVIGAGRELEKVPSLWKPEDIKGLDDISLVDKGVDFSLYDYRNTEENLKKIKKHQFTKESLEVVDESSSYYRITYNGNGIYEEYKKLASMDQWKSFKGSEACEWLPVPPAYNDNYTSYFTAKGYEMFKKFTYPELVKVLDKDNINIMQIDNLPKPVYKDKYQVVCKESFEEVTGEIMNEAYVRNEKDIYYNKDKFDSGEINLCFITGHSGSGKSTMARDMTDKSNIEHYELDDVIANWNFSDDNLKEYGDLIYSFFKGVGKKFRYTSYEDWSNDAKWDTPDKNGDKYEKELTPSFINYCKTYAKSHKDTKFVVEGVWVFHYIEPSELTGYAVYIKGTGLLISKIRAAKRSTQPMQTNFARTRVFLREMSNINNWKYRLLDEKMVTKYKTYFKNKMKDVMKESTLTTEERKDLSNSDYGIPVLKKYPMPDEAHVKSAIRFFNYVDEELDESEINIDKIDKLPKPVYKDKYQVVCKESVEMGDLMLESLETRLTHPLKKKYTLIHGSNEQITRVKAKSLNLGTKLSKMRSSSFWVEKSDIDFAITFGAIHGLSKINAHWYFHKKGNKLWKDGVIVDREKESEVKEYFGKNPVYLYSIEVEAGDIGRGHDETIPEYTIDFDVQPKSEKVGYSKIKSVITYMSKDEIDKIIDDYKDGKLKFETKFKGDLIRSFIVLNSKKAEKRFDTFSKLNNTLGDQSEVEESTLTTEERDELSTSDYGIPILKKYPMPDEAHVKSAIRFFNYVDEEYEELLAKNIKKKIKEFDMEVNVGKKNRLSKYL